MRVLARRAGDRIGGHSDIGGRLAGVSGSALAIALLGSSAPLIAQTVPAPTGPGTNLPSSPSQEAADRPGGDETVPQDQAQVDRAPEPVGEEEEEDAIVVTGFRAAVANAIAEKRESDQILESISAEDIGKLPDNSIAESIARLPGVTAQRVDGRDQVISVRGSQPDFTTTLLNGREQVTTGDNRAVEFDQYPSELLGQVVVYKTPSAGLIGQGVSGTIDLRTIRPLEYGRSVLAVSARGELVTNGALNADTSNKGYRFSGIYVGQFADDTLGITIGAAHMNSPTQYERYNAWGYPTFDCGSRAAYQVAGGGGCNATFAPAQGAFVLGGAKPFVQSNELTRTGVVGTVEWSPTPEWTTTFDAFYTDFREEQQLRGIELPLFWGNATLQPGFTVEDGVITSGTWSDVKGVLRNDYVERTAQIISLGLNTAYTSGPLTLVLDGSYSKVQRDDLYLETYAGTSRFVQNGPYDTLGTQVQSNGITTFTSRLDYTDPALIKITSPQGWSDGPRPTSVPGGQDGFYRENDIDDELYAIRGSVQYELSEQARIEVGANYTARAKQFVPIADFIAATVNVQTPGASLTVPSEYVLGTSDLSYLGIPGQVAFDALGLLRDGFLTRLTAANEPTALNSWTLDENVITGWVRGNFDTPVGTNGSFTGNVGVQVVHTDQSSGGFRVFGVQNATPINDGVTYTEVLPSVNLSFRFDQNDVLRVGIARTLARPRMDQLRASFSYGVNPSQATSVDPLNSFFSAGGGNARLRPWIADGFDVSFEHYFSRTGYFAVAGFYKYLETYIFDSVQIYDFTGTPTDGLPPGLTAPATFLGRISQPVNGSGGVLYGAEVSATLPFDLFTDSLTGLGVLGSYSYTETNIEANPGNPSQPLPGFSKHVASGTAYFERWGFSARGSIRYRSSFLAEVISLGPGARNRQSRGETIVDAQVGYEFQDGFLKGLGILVQGQNLTNEPFVTEDSGNGLIIDNQNYGRRFLAGISYKF